MFFHPHLPRYPTVYKKLRTKVAICTTLTTFRIGRTIVDIREFSTDFRNPKINKMLIQSLRLMTFIIKNKSYGHLHGLAVDSLFELYVSCILLVCINLRLWVCCDPGRQNQ